MQIQHTAKDFELTDAIRSHAEEKLAKACAQVVRDSALRVHVTYETVGHHHHGDNRGIHVVVYLPGGEPLQATEVAGDLYAAIDRAAKDIERQVRRQRDRGAARH